jgi:hypothetical protein
MRANGPYAGHECLAKLVQGTVCKILDAHAVKPHKIRYYLERRVPEFEDKMAQVLCVYSEVEILKEAKAKESSQAWLLARSRRRLLLKARTPCAPAYPCVFKQELKERILAAIHDVQ